MDDYFRSGQHGDRRRRLLTEDLLQSDAGEAAVPRAAGDAERKLRAASLPAEASLMEQLPRVIDLFPRKYLSLSLWFVCGLAVIGALEWAYFESSRLGGLTTDGTIEAFDLDTEGSLGAWFSSFTLNLAAFATLGIYSIRKRHVDDYRARYRIWGWAAACWLVMSIDEAASLHEGFKELLTIVAGTRIAGDGSLWWVLAYLMVLMPLGTLIWIELRSSVFARIALAGAAICYGVAVLAQLQIILPDAGMIEVMLEEGLEMAGNLLLLFSMCLYAKQVIEDLENTPKAKRGRKKTTAKPAAAAKSGKKKAASKRKPKKAAVVEEEEEWSEESEEAEEESAGEEDEASGEEETEDEEAEETEPSEEELEIATRPSAPVKASASPSSSPAAISKATVATPPPTKSEDDWDDGDDSGDGKSYRYDDAEEAGGMHGGGKKNAKQRRKEKRRGR